MRTKIVDVVFFLGWCWFAFLGGVVVSSAHAAGYASAVVGGGAVKTGNAWAVSGASATAANGAFNTPATVTAAGKQVTMPASASFAANAASFAVSAVRLNPAGLMLSLTALWLIEKGLDYVNGTWNKNTSGANQGALYWTGTGSWSVATYGSSIEAARQACLSRWWGAGGTPLSGATYNAMNCTTPAGALSGHVVNSGCTSGVMQNVGGVPSCGPAAITSVPATEADFTAAGSGALPDPVAQELANKDVPIPVNEPVLSPTPVVENYGSPYIDPVTGKTVQTKTRITPEPTAAEPFKVRLESYNVEVAPAPAPVPGDPVPLPKDEQPKDPCLDNPDRFGCLNAGTPEDVDLQTHTPTFSVVPVSIGGAGACPPNPTFTAAGHTFSINYGPMCDAAAWLKPLVLAMAWLSAALIIAGAVRES